MRVLIVEDEGVLAMHHKRIVEDFGYEVVGTIGTGQGAIDLAAEHKPDMILMDINLIGKMSGVEAAIEIQKHMSIPIVFVSAFPDRLCKDLSKLEPCGYVNKPFTASELRVAMEMAIVYNVKAYGRAV